MLAARLNFVVLQAIGIGSYHDLAWDLLEYKARLASSRLSVNFDHDRRPGMP